MSLQFSNSTTRAGIVELIDELLGTDTNSYSLDSKVRDINLALDKVFSIIFQVGGTWQFDDSNHTDYPIITTNVVSGQRDYAFTTDGTSNLLLDIYRVLIADSTGIYRDISPVDVSSGRAPNSYTSGQNITGIPTSYDKLANSVFLDPIPNYNYSGGLKVYINREGSYFASTDTTKKPGFAGLFHEYLALRPAYQYAFRKGLSQAANLNEEMLKMEGDIADYYKSRGRDTQKFIRPILRSSR